MSSFTISAHRYLTDTMQNNELSCHILIRAGIQPWAALHLLSSVTAAQLMVRACGYSVFCQSAWPVTTITSMMVMVTVILLLLSLCHTLMAASVSLGYLDCQPFKVERMAQCAARHQILDLISFSCYEPGKRGPCEEGKRLVLNKESSVSRTFVSMPRHEFQLSIPFINVSIHNP